MAGNPFRRAQNDASSLVRSDASPSADRRAATATKKRVKIQAPSEPADATLRQPETISFDSAFSAHAASAPSPFASGPNATLAGPSTERGRPNPLIADSVWDPHASSTATMSTGSVAPTRAPYNPFARTLATSEAAFGVDGSHSREENATDGQRSSRRPDDSDARGPRLDVDAFANILLTGSAPPLPPPTSALVRSPPANGTFSGSSLPNGNTSALAVSSRAIDPLSASAAALPASRTSLLFHHSHHLHPESPRASFDSFDPYEPPSDDESDSFGNDGLMLMGPVETRPQEIAPKAPPKPTRPRGPQTVSFADFDQAIPPDFHASPPPAHTLLANPHGILRPTVSRSVSDLNKPLPRPPPMDSAPAVVQTPVAVGQMATGAPRVPSAGPTVAPLPTPPSAEQQQPQTQQPTLVSFADFGSTETTVDSTTDKAAAATTTTTSTKKTPPPPPASRRPANPNAISTVTASATSSPSSSSTRPKSVIADPASDTQPIPKTTPPPPPRPPARKSQSGAAVTAASSSNTSLALPSSTNGALPTTTSSSPSPSSTPQPDPMAGPPISAPSQLTGTSTTDSATAKPTPPPPPRRQIVRTATNNSVNTPPASSSSSRPVDSARRSSSLSSFTVDPSAQLAGATATAAAPVPPPPRRGTAASSKRNSTEVAVATRRAGSVNGGDEAGDWESGKSAAAVAGGLGAMSSGSRVGDRWGEEDDEEGDSHDDDGHSSGNADDDDGEDGDVGIQEAPTSLLSEAHGAREERRIPRSDDVSSPQATPVAPVPPRAAAQDGILADMSAFQAEIDALMARAGRTG